jgi:hypothetical protein
MAVSEDHENQELASRLVAAADGIVNKAAAGLERDLRSAAELIHEIDKPTPAVPKLVSELAKIANMTTDVDTQRRLRRLLGEAR